MNEVYAMGAPGGMNTASTGGLGPFIPLLLIFVIFYFLILRPQQLKQKKHKEMLESLGKGDEVVTNGGIHGTIVRIKDNILILKVADKVEIQVSKSAVALRQKRE
jgi:preprotein translocase subunit YajC